jgi:hypothetical protein
MSPDYKKGDALKHEDANLMVAHAVKPVTGAVESPLGTATAPPPQAAKVALYELTSEMTLDDDWKQYKASGKPVWLTVDADGNKRYTLQLGEQEEDLWLPTAVQENDSIAGKKAAELDTGLFLGSRALTIKSGEHRWIVGPQDNLFRFRLKSSGGGQGYLYTADGSLQTDPVTIQRNGRLGYGWGADEYDEDAPEIVSEGYCKYDSTAGELVMVSLEDTPQECIVQSGFTNPAASVPVKVAGFQFPPGEALGPQFYVALNVPDGQDSALFENDLILVGTKFCYTLFGLAAVRACLSPCASLKIGSIIEWSGLIANIPKGWKLCDGSNGTQDRRARFIVGYKNGDAEYGAIGNTGGYKKHGTTENNHNDHYHHTHPTTPTTTGATSGSDFDALTDVTVDNDSADWSHSDSDNRPPYYVSAFIQRVE